MVSPGSAIQIRLALSYLESVDALVQDSRRAFDTGAIAQDRFDSVFAFYSGHRVRAEAIVARLREAERRRLSSLEQELQAVRKHQAQLSRLLADGRITAGRANEDNRRFARELESLGLGISESKAALSAKRPEDLGGQIALSLEEYAQRSGPLDRPSREAPPPRRNIAIAVATALAAVALGMAALGIFPGGANVSFEARASGPRNALITVTCKNAGANPVLFHAPWPEGPRDAAVLPEFGVDVFVSGETAGDFQLLPSCDGCWAYGGRVLLDPAPLGINPDFSESAVLDVTKIERLGLRPRRVRLLCTDARGREQYRFETEIQY